MKGILEIIGVTLVLVIVITIVTIAIFAAFTPFFMLDCNRTAENMDIESKYDFWAGCFLQLNDGSWVKDDYFIVPELR